MTDEVHAVSMTLVTLKKKLKTQLTICYFNALFLVHKSNANIVVFTPDKNHFAQSFNRIVHKFAS